MSDENSETCEVVGEVINKSVSCTNLPEAFLDKVVAKKHFAQFGKIHSFTLSPKRRTCTVEYESEGEAEIALIDGGFYDGEVFDIFFTPKVLSAPRPMIDYIDPDVMDELNAMLPRKPPYLKPFESMEVPITKSMSPTRSLEAKRPPRAKTITDQFSPKLSIRPAPLRSVDQAVKNELETLMRKPALTSDEKYRVLDARDKLIRLTTSKSTDIKTATVTQGVCPDMCPEKERLMREATHRVSSYELEDNSKNIMKHSSALKQYARSSADQESALPHELRPEPILKMTMNYLLHNIVDLCDSSEGNVGDWFHFVWDRTRSIRKDISQQELCSQTAASLIEQCARFHIHCAARLVAEEAQVFDQKINSENLTKCLQSLKYLYHDLNLRREQCVNEAEFRAYVVLLNLNDCQFFWEVKQFPHHILHSKEIRFAIDVYLALANNNYVKFFKLVRQTTYMNACILLRYFNQVRVGALNTMLKAYVPKHSAVMNISYWHYILAFEDYEQTAQFFEYYGLQCDRNDDRIFLDKNAFYYPDFPFTLERAINVVEHKRMCSVGEAIFGGPLDKFDDFLKYVPHDSFDEDGYLCEDAWTAEDQNYLNPPTPKRKSVRTPFREEEPVFKIPLAPSPKSSANQKSSIFSKLSPKIESKTLRENGSLQSSSSNNLFDKPAFSDVTPLNNIFQSSSNKQTQSSTNFFGASSAVTSSQNIFGSERSTSDGSFKPLSSSTRIFGGQLPSTNIFSNFGVVNEIAKTNAFSAIAKKTEDEEMKRLEWEQQRIEMEIQKEEASEAERLRKEEIDRLQWEKEMHEKTERERIRREKADALKRLQKIEQLSAETVVEMVNEFIRDELSAAAAEALECYHQLESAAEGIYNELLEEIIFEESADWERNYQEKIESIDSTPIWLPDKSVDELVSDIMHPLQEETLNMSERYLQGTPIRLTCPAPHADMINIFDIIPQHLHKSLSTIERIRRRPTFWKCGISIPNSVEDKSFQRIDKWLDNLFIRRDQTDPKVFFCEQQFVQSLQQQVAISLRKYRGSELSNEEGIVNGNDAAELNAMVFITSNANLKETKKRLEKVLQYKCGNCVVGIILLNVPTSQQSHIRSELKLDELTTNSEVKYFYSKEDSSPPRVSRNKLLVKCLKWVASNFQFTSSLEMQNTVMFLDQCIGDMFWRRIIASSTLNPGLFKASTRIDFVIDIYNTALEHLANLVTDNFSDHPHFPQEFRRFVKTAGANIPVEYQHFPSDWKNPNRSEQLHSFLLSLRLQPVSLTISSLEEIQQQILIYSQRHITDNIRSDRAAYQTIKVLLEYLKESDNETFQEKIATFSWVNPMRFLALEMLRFQYENKMHDLPHEVIYNRDEIREYLNKPWWLRDDSPMKQVRLSFDCSDATDAPSPKRLKLSVKEELEELISRGAKALERANKQIDKFKKTVIVGREITHDLDSLLYDHEKNLRIQKRWSQMQMND